MPAELDVVIGGSEVGEILLDDGEAHFKSLNVKAGSDVRLRVPGGNLVVDDYVKNIGVIEVTGSTLKAKNLTIGDAVAAVDHCGDWTYTGPSGLFPINNAYVSVGKTFTINNATPLTLNILSGSWIEVGGDHGQVSDQLGVDSGGTAYRPRQHFYQDNYYRRHNRSQGRHSGYRRPGKQRLHYRIGRACMPWAIPQR